MVTSSGNQYIFKLSQQEGRADCAATQAILLAQLRESAEERELCSLILPPNEMFVRCIWTDQIEINHSTQEVGRKIHVCTLAQRRWVKRKHLKEGQNQDNLFNLTT